MRKYHGVVIDTEGNAVSGVSVYVYPTGTTSVVALYEDEGITPKTNPVVTDDYGMYWFYVVNGDYDLYFTGGTITDYTLSDVTIYDDIQKGAASIAGLITYGNTATETRNTATTEGLTGGLYIEIGAGTSTIPLTTKKSVIYAEKYTANNEGTPPYFDSLEQGVATFKTIKKSGNCHTINLNSIMLRDGGGGNCVSLMGWAENHSAPGQYDSTYSGWFYVINWYDGALGSYLHGIEIDVDERASDAGHGATLGSASNKTGSIGLWISCPQTTSLNTTMAIGITPRGGTLTSTSEGRFHSGLYFMPNAIVPTDANGLNEAIFLAGGTEEQNDYTGIRFYGYLQKGLDFAGSVCKDGIAISLQETDRIFWMDTSPGTTHCYFHRYNNDIYWNDGTDSRQVSILTKAYGIVLKDYSFTDNSAIQLDDGHRIYWIGTPNTYMYRSSTNLYWFDGTAGRKLDFIPQVYSGINDTVDGTWGAEESGVLDAIRDALVTWGLITAS